MLQSMFVVVRVGAHVIVPSSARVASTGEQEEVCTHRLVDGSAWWILRKTSSRIVQVSGLAELVGLALGEIGTVEELKSVAQKTLATTEGGCIIYTVSHGEGSRAEAASVAECGLGLGLESVVGWKTAGSKLMIFVSKPLRQLASERRAAFGVR